MYGIDLPGTLQGAGTIGGILSADLNGTTAYYCYDANGNLTELLDTNGAAVAHYEYAPFGAPLSATGPASKFNSFRFSSKYTYDETGLLYYGYRYYSPGCGRWLARDPLGEFEGPYLYLVLKNNAVLSIDPFGFYTTIAWSDFEGTSDAASPRDATIFWYHTFTYGEKKAECKEVSSSNCTGKRYKVTTWNPTTRKNDESFTDCKLGCKCFECSLSYPSFTVLGMMIKKRSWVKAGAATATLLGHEQLHLSIAEKVAAVATPPIREITGKGVNCTENAAANDALEDWIAQKDVIWAKLDRVDETVQGKYDTDTLHGGDATQQAAWASGFEDKVAAEW